VTSWQEAFELAEQGSGKFSIGGMRSKLSAVEKGFAAGFEVVIGNGRKPSGLKAIVEGEGVCTRFRIQD